MGQYCLESQLDEREKGRGGGGGESRVVGVTIV